MESLFSPDDGSNAQNNFVIAGEIGVREIVEELKPARGRSGSRAGSGQSRIRLPAARHANEHYPACAGRGGRTRHRSFDIPDSLVRVPEKAGGIMFASYEHKP